MSQGQSKPFTYRQSYLLNIEFNFVCITSTYFYLVYKKCLDSRWNYFYIYMYMYYTQYNGRHYFGHRGKIILYIEHAWEKINKYILRRYHRIKDIFKICIVYYHHIRYYVQYTSNQLLGLAFLWIWRYFKKVNMRRWNLKLECWNLIITWIFYGSMLISTISIVMTLNVWNITFSRGIWCLCSCYAI